MSYADKTEIYNILSINDVFANLSATSKTDRLNLVIGDALSRYDEIVKYLNSKLTNDMQTFSSIASGFHIDQYIDASSAAALRTVITSVTDFKTNVDGLYKSLTTLNGNGSLVNSGIDNVNVLYAHNDLITRVAMGVGLSTDFVSRNNSFLSIMHRLSTYQHASLVNIRSLINNVAKDYEIESPVYFIIGQSNRSSSIYLILYGDNTLPGMVTYLNKTPAVNININTVGLLYQAITGDPNPSN
jgi:hypothetical protein